MRTWIISILFATAVSAANSPYDAVIRMMLEADRGNVAGAQHQAEEIGKADAPLGHFADGYLAYRQKEYGRSRGQLREAFKTARKPSTRILALTWLGRLQRETQQYDEAFWAFEKILTIDAALVDASLEIGRTSLACGCRVERGEEALARFLMANPDSSEARELRAKLATVQR